MFESLQDGLQSALKSLRGKGKLTEKNMRDGLRAGRAVAVGSRRQLLGRQGLHGGGHRTGPGAEGADCSGPQRSSWWESSTSSCSRSWDRSMRRLHLRDDVTVLMLCGLQGSGKTTTCGKLARLISAGRSQAHAGRGRPAAARGHRTAACDWRSRSGCRSIRNRVRQDPVKVCRDAVKKAAKRRLEVVILDTAGRLAIDEELMEQLKQIDRQVQPHQVYLVVDGMTGQDAVNSAAAFNEALELDGVILTKLDGDARGGAVLSVKHVTGVPIKFIGTGERLDALGAVPSRRHGRSHPGHGRRRRDVPHGPDGIRPRADGRDRRAAAKRRVHARRFPVSARPDRTSGSDAKADGADAGHGRIEQDDEAKSTPKRT